MSEGVAFFNFGGGCMVRLLVALHSLRKNYGGGCVVFLAQNDDFNKQAAADISKVANIKWFDLEKLAKRNLKSAIKPTLFQMSDFDTTLMLDGDLLIQKDVTPLLKATTDHGFLVTRFSTWNTDGGRMRARVGRLGKYMWPSDMATLKGKHPAINIGVMGWAKTLNGKSNSGIIQDWNWLTMNIAGQHIADEIAAQCCFHRHPHYVAEATWNDSCIFNTVPFAETSIIHYHGNKHAGVGRPSSRRWLAALAQLKASGRCQGMDTYLTWNDKSLLGTMKKNPNLLVDALKWDEAKHQYI